MNPNLYLESAAEKIEPSLKALQVQYRDIIEKYQPVVDHAHAQLTYIDGVLSGFSTIPANAIGSKSLEKSLEKSSAKSSAKSADNSIESAPVKSVEKSPEASTENSIMKLTEKSPKPTAKKTLSPAKGAVKTPRKAPKPSNTSKTLQFIAKYLGETLTSAVGKILSDRQGREVGIEEVVSVLYGDIDSEEFKVAKDRVTKNLSKGKVSGLWDRVDGKSGYYIAKA
jgi:hypothetical protein